MHRVLIVLIVLWITADVADVTSTQQSSNATVGAGGQSRSPLEGVWKIVEVSSRVPGSAWIVATPPYLSMYIFTGKHYSYMFAPGVGPRRLFAGDPNRPSDGDKVAAYRFNRRRLRDVHLRGNNADHDRYPSQESQRDDWRTPQVHSGNRRRSVADDHCRSAIRAEQRATHSAHANRVSVDFSQFPRRLDSPHALDTSNAGRQVRAYEPGIRCPIRMPRTAASPRFDRGRRIHACAAGRVPGRPPGMCLHSEP